MSGIYLIMAGEDEFVLVDLRSGISGTADVMTLKSIDSYLTPIQRLDIDTEQVSKMSLTDIALALAGAKDTATETAAKALLAANKSLADGSIAIYPTLPVDASVLNFSLRAGRQIETLSSPPPAVSPDPS